MAEFDPVEILRVLNEHGVRYVLVGGVAARLRGAPLVTVDLDVTPEDAVDNIEALAAALTALEAKLRSPTDPDGVAFPIDAAILGAAQSWTLTTRAGDLDLVFRPAGTQGYADLVRHADQLTVSTDPEVTVAVASLADVIRSKEAAGRDKDRAALPLLRRTLDEIAQQGD